MIISSHNRMIYGFNYQITFSISCFFTLYGAALATWCHICDYTKADSCEHSNQYKLVDCQAYWPESRHCLKFNGTRRATRQDGGNVTATGVHRACQLEREFETFGLYNVQPGCRNMHVLNKNTTLYKEFIFDGVLCVCDETGCNHAGRVSVKEHGYWIALFTVFFTVF